MKMSSTKTKLTLTVRKSIIVTAKKYARKSGKSISTLFEEMFQGTDLNQIKSEPQRAAERLLNTLEVSKSIKTLNDKILLRKHVGRKYA